MIAIHQIKDFEADCLDKDGDLSIFTSYCGPVCVFLISFWRVLLVINQSLKRSQVLFQKPVMKGFDVH